MDTLHTEIFLRNSKGLAGKNLYLKVKRRKWLSFQNNPWLLLTNQTKSWENRFCFYEVHEGSVKDCLTHLGISITRLRDTNSRHSVTFAACEKVVFYSLVIFLVLNTAGKWAGLLAVH